MNDNNFHKDLVYILFFNGILLLCAFLEKGDTFHVFSEENGKENREGGVRELENIIDLSQF